MSNKMPASDDITVTLIFRLLTQRLIADAEIGIDR